MAALIYMNPVSLDGYITDPDGRFDWYEPSEEVFAFISDRIRPVGTYLYGRRMYETMRVWETDPTLADQSPLARDFAEIWRAADKIVYSTTLEQVATERTRLERGFDVDTLRQLKATADRDFAIGGAHLAAHAVKAGLVDEYQLFVAPVAVGGGTPFFPLGVRVALDLVEGRRFRDGVVYLRYRAVTPHVE